MIDWGLASRIGGGIAGDPPVTPLPVDLAAVADEACDRVVAYTGLHPARAIPPPEAVDRRTWLDASLTFVRRQPLGTVGLVVVIVAAVAGLSAEWIAPYSPTANDFAVMTEPPSSQPMGNGIISPSVTHQMKVWSTKLTVGSAIRSGA